MQVRKASRTSKSDSPPMSISLKLETKESSIEVIVPWCTGGLMGVQRERDLTTLAGNAQAGGGLWMGSNDGVTATRQ